jgi:hypothetical protein
MNELHSLAIMSQPAVAQLHFGWFDLAWPNIAMWIAILVLFPLLAWARIPTVMEMDAAAREAQHEGEEVRP